MRALSGLSLVVVLLVGLLAPSSARAQDLSLVDPVARVHLEKGVQFFVTKHYAEAVAEFEAGYRIEPDAAFLFAWAQAERLRGNCVDAAPLYKKVLANRPTAQQETVARHHLALCEAVLPRPWYKDPVGDSLVAAGLVGLGTGIGLFFGSARAADAAGNATDYATFNHNLRTAQTERTAGIVLLSVGAAATVAGVIELGLGSKLRSSRPRDTK